MARSLSDEELKLRKRARRRLIGAVVLAAIAAVVLPMVLDSEPKQFSQEVSIKIPSPDSGTFTSKIVPVAPRVASKPAPEASVPETKPKLVPEQLASAAPAAVKKAAQAEAKTESPKAAPKTAKDNAKTAEQGKDQFVVQVVALSDADRAQQIQQQISAAGIKSYTEIVKTAKGDVTRVRAGPYTTRAAAEKAREQLKAMGLNGNVAAK
jgi:DedD protein